MRFPTLASSTYYQPHTTILRSVSQQNPYFCLSFGGLTPLYDYPGAHAVLDKEAQPLASLLKRNSVQMSVALSLYLPILSSPLWQSGGSHRDSNHKRWLFRFHLAQLVCAFNPHTELRIWPSKCISNTHHLRLQAALACASLSCTVITASGNTCEVHIWSQLVLVRCIFATGLLLPAKKH